MTVAAQRHRTRPRARLAPGLWLVVLCGFASLAPSLARAECTVSANLSGLLGAIWTYAGSDAPATPQGLEQLRRSLATATEREITADFHRIGLSPQHPDVKRLMAEIAAIGQGRSPPSTEALRVTLLRIDGLIGRACAGYGASLRDTSGPQTALDNSLAPGAADETSSRPPEEASLRPLLILLAALLGTIIAVTGASLGYRWIYAMIHNRKACRIYGGLELGMDVIDGSITILGRKGCRFAPVNPGAYGRLEGIVQHETDCFVVAGRRRLPARIDGLHGTFAVILFETQLDMTVLDALFASSVITPRDVPKTQPASNIERFRKPS